MRYWIAVAGALVLVFVTQVSFTRAAPSHGLSTFGDLAYPADFKHFKYVNPDAPKGGRIVTIGTEGRTTFDSLNGYILRGTPAQMLGLLFDTLMVRAADEPDAMYGLVAETVDVADDKMSVTFKMRKEAKFSDGTPLTAEDVQESFRLIKEEGNPRFQIAIRDVEKCEVLNSHEVRFTFKGKNVRDLPQIVASLPIFSKAYYSKVKFNKTTLKPPLGSGPYLVKDLEQGRFITYERRNDYWAKDLPVNKGQLNFGEIKLLYFRDRTAEFEALKAGDIDLREEFTSRVWANGYNIKAVEEGRLIKELLPDLRPSGAQGFFFNMRREKFKDPRVREAIGLAFDFEWSNEQLFFNLYKRTHSIFENSNLKSTGKPNEAELAILKSLKAKVNPAVFEEAFLPPVSNASGQDKKLLKRAFKLLKAAGWKQGQKNGKTGLFNEKGEPFKIEFLMFSPAFERVISPYIRNLRLLGIDAQIRLVEAAQYQERLKRFDYDLVSTRFALSQTPGVALRAFFGSRSADLEGSYNLSGLKDPAVDELIGRIIQAKSREELTNNARVLDRVLRVHHFWVPHWYKAAHSVAYWDKFARPATKPAYARGILSTWWVDKEKEAKLKRGN